MDLKRRAVARAALLGFDTPSAAIASYYGAPSFDDNRVRALWQVLSCGRPSYERVLELCRVFRFAPEHAGVWFADDDTARAMLAIEPINVRGVEDA